ncbi:MAG: DUF3987 domain-containing protein [Terriglobales bacterium]
MSEETKRETELLDQFLLFNEVATLGEWFNKGKQWYRPIDCPWASSHENQNQGTSTCIIYTEGGGYTFDCKHRCAHHDWKSFRAELESRSGKRFAFKSSAPEPTVVLGEARVPEASQRAVYPAAVWDGTLVGEFAKVCTADNFIPAKLFIESFRTYLAAALGDRLSGPYRGTHTARMFTVIIAPPSRGKGEAIRSTDEFFENMKEMIVGYPTPWRPKGIGAANLAFSSVPGLSRVILENKKFQEVSPHLCWRGTIPRIITVQEELKSLLSSLFIEGGSGTDLEAVLCALWDGTRFHGKAKGEREAVYGQVQLSLLGGITPDDWFALLGQGDVVGSGFYSRLNIVGTGGEYAVVKLKQIDSHVLQESLLPRLESLANAPCQMAFDAGADDLLDAWIKELPSGSERLNIYVMRTALLLAWLKGLDSVTTEVMEGALQLGDHQLRVRQFYHVKVVENQEAALEAKIKKYVGTKGASTKRDVARGVHYERCGVTRFEKAWQGLTRSGVLVAIENTEQFGLAQGEDW